MPSANAPAPPAPTFRTAAGIPFIRPFSGLLPRRDMADRIAAPPYDIVSSDEARTLANGNEWSFLRVSKAEIDFSNGIDPYSPQVYERAGENLRRMVEAGVLRRDVGSCYYIYRIEDGEHIQTGLAVVASIDAYKANRIRRHEVTRPEKENDRVRQILAVGAQTGPVMAVHRSDPLMADRLARIATTEPELAAIAADGSRHSVWRVDEPGDIAFLTEAFSRMDALYIADGHHRSAAAARVAQLRERPGGTGAVEAAHNYMLLVCFPEKEARILGYHRVVRDLAGLSPEAFLKGLQTSFGVQPMAAGSPPEGPGRFSMYLASRWYALDLRPQAAAVGSAVARLDVSVLAQHILEPILGIGDPRIDPRIDFVGGRDSLHGLKSRVDGGQWAVAFAVHPMSMGELCAVADAGEIMPPKSTWFDPKLLDGLVSYPLD